MTGERYVWILRGIGYVNRQFLTQDDPSVSCTAEEMIAAGQTAIIPNWVFHTDYPGITISGETAAENEERYKAVAGNKFMSFYTYPYDAVFAMAAAMNSSIDVLAQVNKTLDNFDYDDVEMRDIIMDQLDKLDAEGLSGPLAFENGDRLGRFIIEQVWDGEPRTVGYYYDNDNRFDWSGEYNISWIGGNPPHDEIFFESELLTMPRSVYAAISVLSYLGIILAIAFLAFNVALRNQRTIKLSSPNINNIIILGSIMTFSSVVLMGTDARIVSLQKMDLICRARLWTLSLGFTLAFGAMFSKTFRVHKIFINKKLQKRSVKDYQLVVMVGGFVFVESLYLLIWDVVNPLRAQVIQFTEDASASEDRVIIPELQVCRRNGINSLSWLSGIYIFNGILLMFGLFLAFETRAVKIRALNDAKNIGISVYNVSILSSVGALFNLVMDPKDYTLVYIVTGMCVIVSTITTLLVIFLPKVIDVIKYPDGAPVSTMPDEFSTNLSTANTNGGEQRKKPFLPTVSSKVGDGESATNGVHNGHPSPQKAWSDNKDQE
ncbi:gamma-aminobutyric acid type B receptor subunit 2-like [Lytechinus pictus]|uniref:gamma-aminobutyric acid type B receptor subunit 2-like n=1 Tax=Lytechinus pictus TaxID=7653 RepID=UPI0030B9D8D5